MTEAELFAALKAEALKTSIDSTEFLHRVATNPAYPYAGTHWRLAMRQLDALLALWRTPPPPPPPPTGKQRLGVFQQPGVFCSWELLSLGYSPAQIAREAHDLGAKWVALDVAINPVGDRNVASLPDVHVACGPLGITVGTWGEVHSGAAAAQRALGAFHIVNREQLDQTEPNFLSAFRAFRGPNVELGVVAGPFDAFPHPDLDPAGWQQHVKAEGWLDVPMIVEAYTSENPNATPLRQAAEAGFRGFAPVAVVVESNRDHGWNLDAIPDDTGQRFGNALSLYLLGTARDTDKAKFKRLIGAA